MNEPGNIGTTQTAAIPLSERVRSLRLPETNESAGGGWWWLPWVIVGVLMCALGLLAIEAFSPLDDDTIKKLADARGLNLRKDNPQLAPLARLGLPTSARDGVPEIALESKGYIVPISLIQVSPKISGTVMNLYIEEGNPVRKGDTLAKLEVVEYKSDFDRTKAAVDAAKARLDELLRFRPEEILQAKADWDDAVAQMDQANAKYARARRLKEGNAITPEDLEAAKSGFVSTESRAKRLELTYAMMKDKGPRDEKIKAAEADIRQAVADFEKADWRYKNTEVKAPIDGIILSKKTEEGNIVNPSAFSNGLSASLCEMADLFKMEVDLSIAERDISKVFAQQECRLRAEAFPDRIYRGQVSRIMPMADRSKGAIPVRVKIQFPAVDSKGEPLPSETQGQFLRPEMGAIVTFLNRKAESKDSDR